MLTYRPDQGTEEHFRPIRPSEAIGVYTDMTDRRFTDMEKSFQDKLTAAMKWEDSVLKTYMDKHRLEQWAENASQEAKETVTELVDEATRAGAEGNGREVEVDGLAKTNGKIA
jgi:nuclear pore complex protein Nup133